MSAGTDLLHTLRAAAEEVGHLRQRVAMIASDIAGLDADALEGASELILAGLVTLSGVASAAAEGNDVPPEVDCTYVRLSGLVAHLDGALRQAGVIPDGARLAHVGETCSCGAPATVVYETARFGDVPSCGANR